MKFSASVVAATLLGAASASAVIPRAVDTPELLPRARGAKESFTIKDFSFHRGEDDNIHDFSFTIAEKDDSGKQYPCKAWKAFSKTGNYDFFNTEEVYWCGPFGKWQFKYTPKYTAPLNEKSSRLYLWDARKGAVNKYNGYAYVPGPDCKATDDGGKTCKAQKPFNIDMIVP